MYDDYRRNLATYFGRTVTHIAPAIALGYLTDQIIRGLQLKLNLTPIVAIVLHLVIVIIVMYLSERILSSLYRREWRGKTPSNLFTGFYFIMQTTLFKNLLLVQESWSLFKP